MTDVVDDEAEDVRDLRFVWLEITGKCQLECVHCYADSGPSGSQGSMSRDDWCRVIDQCAALGVGMVQFIGGEPTRHPDLPVLVDHALVAGLEVEVFSNLVHVSAAMWDTFERPGVRLACSYYSDDPDEHTRVTKRNTHAQTRKNIAEAVRRSIPIRVGLIEMFPGQRTEEAVAELRALGVEDIGSDRLRQVGRGVRELQASPDQLCGNCADGVLAVSPSGEVWPCVFSRWMPVGNLSDQSLAEVLSGEATARARAELSEHFGAAAEEVACDPACNPHCTPSCHPNCRPTCNPTCSPMCNPHCQPTCPPRCSPTCGPIKCGPRSCWPKY